MKRSTLIYVAVIPWGRDTTAVDRIITDAGRLNRATKLFVQCEADRHTLGRLVDVPAEGLVFVMDVHWDSTIRERDPDTRQLYTVPGKTLSRRTIVFIEAVERAVLSTRCPCGPAEIPRSWIMQKYETGRERAALPQAKFQALADERHRARRQQDAVEATGEFSSMAGFLVDLNER